MQVTKGQIIARGLKNCCPNCGRHSLFPPHSFRIHQECPFCHTALDRGPGFFLGPWVLNYTVVVFGLILPAIVLGVTGHLPWSVSLTISILGCVAVPALLYRPTWSWWLMLYFLFVPG